MSITYDQCSISWNVTLNSVVRRITAMIDGMSFFVGSKMSDYLISMETKIQEKLPQSVEEFI